MKKSDFLIYTLSYKMLIGLYIYYILLIVIGVTGSIFIICSISHISNDNILVNTLIASLSVCNMLNGVQYTKRLYKACLTERISDEVDKVKRIGNVVYFILRPLFADVFVIVLIFSLLSGMLIVTGDLNNVANEKFLYLCVILSSFIGNSVGKVIDKFEQISNKKINELSDGVQRRK